MCQYAHAKPIVDQVVFLFCPVNVCIVCLHDNNRKISLMQNPMLTRVDFRCLEVHIKLNILVIIMSNM